jgi:hypothetical protein
MLSEKEQIASLYQRQRTLEEKLQILEARGPEYPILKVPDYTSDLCEVKKSVDRFLNSSHQKNMDETFVMIKGLVSRIPDTIHVQNHHHFAKLTGRVILAFTVLVICLVFSTWLAYYFYKHSNI